MDVGDRVKVEHNGELQALNYRQMIWMRRDFFGVRANSTLQYNRGSRQIVKFYGENSAYFCSLVTFLCSTKTALGGSPGGIMYFRKKEAFVSNPCCSERIFGDSDLFGL